MRPSQLLTAVTALATVAATWPDAFDASNALADVRHMLYPRQDNPSTTDAPAKTADASESPKETGDASTTDKPSATATNTGDDKDSKPTGSDSGSASATNTGTGKGSGTASGKSSKPTATKFGNDVPAGGIAMITPDPYLGRPLYKIGDDVHMVWNMTSVKKTPSAVDIMATCTQNQATYTIAVNQSVSGPTGEVWWQTSKYAEEHPNSPPLLMAVYTLLIYDSNSSVSATAQPGYLAAYNQHTFGMYEKQPYQNWTEGYTCPTCNGALSPLEALTLKAMVLTSATTIGSLLYFSYSFGLL